jgi:pyruvate dehydrogenase E1 component alpha subunit
MNPCRPHDRVSAARQVLQLRYWQMLFNEMLKASPARFRIPIHLAIGHEALAAAVDAAMNPPDQLVLTHRNVAYHLARSGALEPVQLEYLLSAAGAGGGRMGSMNLVNPARQVVYTSSILGNNLPVACGLAMANKVKGTAARVYVLTGDGAMEEGVFWETLVFAESHKLDVTILVENNDHSLASRIAERRCALDLAELCAAVGVRFDRLEANDPIAYANKLAAEPGQGPVCVEAMVTTFSNHAGATPGWAADPKTISIEGGLVLDSSPRDPAWVARQQLEADEYDAMSCFLASMAAAVLGEQPDGQNREDQNKEGDSRSCQTTSR